VSAFSRLRSLILVDCGLTQLPVLDAAADCLETLDVRRNRLRVLAASVAQCGRLRTLRLSHNALRRLPTQLADSLTTLDCAFNRLKRLTTHLLRCTQLRCLQVCSIPC